MACPSRPPSFPQLRAAWACCMVGIPIARRATATRAAVTRTIALTALRRLVITVLVVVTCPPPGLTPFSCTPERSACQRDPTVVREHATRPSCGSTQPDPRTGRTTGNPKRTFVVSSAALWCPAGRRRRPRLPPAGLASRAPSRRAVFRAHRARRTHVAPPPTPHPGLHETSWPRRR